MFKMGLKEGRKGGGGGQIAVVYYKFSTGWGVYILVHWIGQVDLGTFPWDVVLGERRLVFYQTTPVINAFRPL